MLTVHTIKHFDLWETDFDDLCLFTAQLTLIVNQYENLRVTVPEWFLDRLNESVRVLSERLKVGKQAQIKRLRAQRETYLSDDTKLANVDAKILALEAETR